MKLTPAKAYLQVVCCFCIVCFGNLPFYTLSPLQGSLAGALGLVASGVYMFMWVVGSLLVGTIVSVLGLKLTAALASWLSLAFVVGYYYPSWPTLLITAFISGLALGPHVSVPAICTNIMACSLASLKGKDVTHYVGPFQGFVSSGFFVGAVFGNVISSTIFFIDEYLSGSVQNVTYLPPLNESHRVRHLHVNLTFDSDDGVCALESATREVTSGALYVLLAVATISSISSAVISTICLARPPNDSSVCASPKQVFTSLTTSLHGTVGVLATPRYLLCIVLGGYTGMSLAFFFGFGTKYIVTDCIGIVMVGIVTAVYSFCYAVSTFVTGKLVVHVPRTVCAFCLLLLAVAIFVFLLTWKRSPSYPVVFLLAVAMGIESGSVLAVAQTYLGVVASKEPEKVFGVFWATRALGLAVVFFITSVTNSIAIVGSVLLGCLMISFSLYFIAEARYGEKLLTKVYTCICKEKWVGYTVYYLDET